MLDLDNDANNNKVIEPSDDPIEHFAPGRYLYVNSDDHNSNNIPDRDENGPISEEDDLEPINIGWTPRSGFDYTDWHIVLTIDPEPESKGTFYFGRAKKDILRMALELL